VNWRVREPDADSSAEARPRGRRVWSGGNRDPLVDIPDLHGLGNAPYGCRDEHGHHARHAALDRLGPCSRVFDVGGHDGCNDGPAASPVIRKRHAELHAVGL